MPWVRLLGFHRGNGESQGISGILREGELVWEAHGGYDTYAVVLG